MRRARALSSVEVPDPLFDFSAGLYGGQTDAAARVRHLRYADNVEFEPIRGFSLRKGYRDLNGAVMPAAGHSLMAYYAANGTATFFAGSADKIYKLETAVNTLQTLPITPTATGKWTHANLNGVLIAVQQGASNVPIFYDGTSWKTLTFPTPAAPTLTSMTAGGATDAGVHYYRVRYLFTNGVSLVSTTLLVTVVAPNHTVNLALPAAPAGRSDYLGVRIERTQAGGAAGGPYYFVANVLTPTVAYADAVSDAAYTDRVQVGEPGSGGQAPALDGITTFRSRLIGFKGSLLYVGQGISDLQGSGIMNFNPAQEYPIKKDDGDPIQLALNTPGERLAIIKGASGHALDGDDPDNFSITQLWDGVGAAGPRAAAIVGNRIVFYAGQGRLMEWTGSGDPQPAGDLAVGHYLRKIAATADPDVLVFNYRGTHILVGYTESPDTYNKHVLVYRTAYKHWTHYKDWRMSDALAPKRPENAGGVTLLFADPKNIDGSQQQAGGTKPSFVSWTDNRTATSQVYVQKMLSTGQAAWTTNGVVVSASTASIFNVVTSAVLGLADGGCVVLYREQIGATANLMAQRFDTNGAKLWGAPGVTVAAGLTSLMSGSMRVIFDGITGFFFSWVSSTAFVRRCATDGTFPWAAVSCGTSVVQHENNQLLPDGSGGAYVAWSHNPSGSNYNVAAQHVNDLGARLWAVAGVDLGLGWVLHSEPYRVPVCVESGNLVALIMNVSHTSVTATKRNAATGAATWTSTNLGAVGAPTLTYADSGGQMIVPSTGGNLFAIWQDVQASDTVLRVMLINSSGVAQWTSAVSAYSYGTLPGIGGAEAQRVVQDGGGGLIFVIRSMFNPPGALYAVKVQADGLLVWGTPKTISDIAGDVRDSGVVTDGSGGAIVYFRENVANNEIRAARVRANGGVEWAANGYALASGLTGARYQANGSFANTPSEASFPAGDFSGYHVWVGFTGFSDEAAVDGTGGVPINWMIETPEMDGGAPDVLKEFARFELLVKTGLGAISATLTLDAGRVVNVSLAASRSSAKWGKRGVATKANTLIWGPKSASSPYPNNPRKWAGQRSQNIPVGLPNSTVGTRYKIALRAALQSEMLIEGFTTDYRPLPERPYT